MSKIATARCRMNSHSSGLIRNVNRSKGEAPMKRYIAIAAILIAASFTLPDDLSPHALASGAKCTGANPCRACSTCEYCKHCAKEGGTCGICKPKKKPAE